MEKIQKGLHGLNAKLPKVSLQLDFLSFSLQQLSLFACIASAFMWAINGFDSTIDGWINVMEWKSPVEMGNGTHWSTLVNFFLLVFLISLYLSRKEVIGFHNVIISVFTPIVGMMVFEIPWHLLVDYFHNIHVEGYWAITGFGLGKLSIGMLIIGAFLVPTSLFYITFQALFNRFSDRVVVVVPWLVCAVSFVSVTAFSLMYGTPDILLRNSMGLFFGVFVHASLMDAMRNPTVKGLIGKKGYKYKYKWRNITALTAGLISLSLFIAWIFYSDFGSFEVIKGTMFPQTVYAFYNAGNLDRFLWVQNDGIHFLNVASKFAVTFAVALLMVPKIEVEKNEKN